jgi:hypothetical protein
MPDTVTSSVKSAERLLDVMRARNFVTYPETANVRRLMG